ncbi:MAG: iduronate-2-sulfatase, partial [Verrucomicrobiae bacterium]|nr:iduronate-2-sulfatase [Verrucomicrobiae bacterium]
PGVSLVPALRDAGAAPRDAALTQYANGYSLRTPQWRYTEWGDNGALGNELYDHDADPDEMVNLAGKAEHADTVAQLSRQLHDRIVSAKAKPAGLSQVAPTSVPKPKRAK